MSEVKRKCSICGEYVDVSEWPIYGGKPYGYCRSCKRFTQRIWVRQKREMLKTKSK
jgi:hypothetical protein